MTPPTISSEPVARRPHSSGDLVSPPGTTNPADLVERVLDKGVAVAGDINLSLGGVGLLGLRVGLLVTSIDKAQEIGINWRQSDPALSSRASSRAKELEPSEQERNLLKERLDPLEGMLLAPPREADQKHSEAGQWSNVAAAYVLDPEGSMIAELKQPAQQPQGEERPQAPECAGEPEAEQTAQPLGAAPLLGPALQEHIAQAIRPVLGVVL
jgi:gas vesicle protein GvpA/GvpJ/GvpM family